MTPPAGPLRAERTWTLRSVIGTGAAAIAGATWMASWTSEQSVAGPIVFLGVLAESLPAAGLWLAAAFGVGWPIQKLLITRREQRSWLIQMGLGVAVMLVLDASLGALGALQVGGRVGAIALAVACAALTAVPIVQHVKRRRAAPSAAAESWSDGRAGALLLFALAPAMAVLIVASASAPGWLWRTEFGGYDALSYHLQLPKEWIGVGRIVPFDHNVYSFLPGYVEAMYYHVALLRGDSIEGAASAQILHSAFVVLSALSVATLIRRWIPSAPRAGARSSAIPIVAGAALIGTPWVVVIGSLAYNEMVAVFMMCAALLVFDGNEPRHPLRTGVAVGMLAAAACGAKLTAVGFVAIPTAVFAAMHVFGGRQLVSFALSAVAAGVLMLLPYLARNTAVCGNPLFPFASDMLGQAHWTPEQFGSWQMGHTSGSGAFDRGSSLLNQWIRFGIGPSPLPPNEPWIAQWTVLPLLGIIGLAFAIGKQATRRVGLALTAALVIQLVFWVMFTHLQSRFLVPTIVPLSLGIGLGLSACWTESSLWLPRLLWTTLCAVGAVALSLQSVFVFRGEGGGAPADRIGVGGILTGRDLTGEQRRQVSATAPSVFVNHALPSGSRVLLVGDAAPFYMDQTRIAYSTVWDRGPLSRTMDESSDSSQWVERLRESGFTHVLVDAGMLHNWAERGWGDPRLAPDEFVAAFDRHARLIHTFDAAGSIRVYSLR